MDEFVKSSAPSDDDQDAAFRDELEELKRYLAKPTLSRKECPDPVAWWGVSTWFPA